MKQPDPRKELLFDNLLRVAKDKFLKNYSKYNQKIEDSNDLPPTKKIEA